MHVKLGSTVHPDLTGKNWTFNREVNDCKFFLNIFIIVEGKII